MFKEAKMKTIGLQIANLYELGMSAKTIAQKTNMSLPTVIKILKEQNVYVENIYRIEKGSSHGRIVQAGLI